MAGWQIGTNSKGGGLKRYLVPSYFNVLLCCSFLPVIRPPLGSACGHTVTRLFKLVTFVANQDLGNPGTNPVFLDLVYPRVEAHQGPDVVDVIHKHNCINISEIPRI